MTLHDLVKPLPELSNRAVQRLNALANAEKYLQRAKTAMESVQAPRQVLTIDPPWRWIIPAVFVGALLYHAVVMVAIPMGWLNYPMW